MTRLMTVMAAAALCGAARAGDFWAGSQWLSSADAKVATEAEMRNQLAAEGVTWVLGELENAAEVASAKWTTSGLGVYELYVNGARVGDGDALKPGFTHCRKTRRSFVCDVTAAMKRAKGAKNLFAAEVSASWWSDKCPGYVGKKPGFRGVLEVTYADGSAKRFGTDPATWKAVVGGPVLRAGIFDGEHEDARRERPDLALLAGRAVPGLKPAVVNAEFKGEILPSAGAEICRRFDLALEPVEAYCWKGVTGADKARNVFGKVVKTRTFDPKGALEVAPGETLVVDFGQNCAGVPEMAMSAARGVKVEVRPAEALNDANGERGRGNDGPGGSVYRENLRLAWADGMRFSYVFAGQGVEKALPRHTFFGYRYASITADGPVKIAAIRSIPVTSIRKEMELGAIETGDKDVNRLIQNVYWGQLSNYLSIPTDCPQRNERQGWTADTQVFTEAGSFNADTYGFMRKFLRDMRDTQTACGSYTGVAPFGEYGDAGDQRLCWSDCGVIVPYRMWRQFGKTDILAEHWASMEKFMDWLADNRYAKDRALNYQWADWLSYEPYESCSGRYRMTVKGADGKSRSVIRPETSLYWKYLGAFYWVLDSGYMKAMAGALGKADAVAKYAKMEQDARAYMKETFLKDGKLPECLRALQTPALCALHLGLLEGADKEALKAALLKNFKDHGDCLQTGFLGTSILMDTLTDIGCAEMAYTLLLQHKNPSWLYSVDQGATTIWERWNSYVKSTGFGPVGMNSFNHYAYGAVLAWMYKTAAGIASDPTVPGFKRIVMKPIPDRRLGHVTASYKSAAGLVKSAWRYEGADWVWEFEVPAGATALVTLPGETAAKEYGPGRYVIRRKALTPPPAPTCAKSALVGEVQALVSDPGWRARVAPAVQADGSEVWAVTLEADAERLSPGFELRFSLPQVDMRHVWSPHHPTCHLNPDWAGSFSSNVARWMPLYQVLNDTERNRLTLACSETKGEVRVQLALREEGCRLVGTVVLADRGATTLKRFTTKIRVDRRDVFWADALREASDWISAEQTEPPLVPPAAAFKPLYSAWYSFHQDVFDKDVEAECRIAAGLGMKTVIVDDGWQTDDTNRGYSFCGDWQISKRRFPDMKAHVAKVHALGMKYMIWYSVPFVGMKSANYSRFKGKYLHDSGWGAAVLDPRFPEVRAFLAETYEKAMRDWDLDGLKLDFIDSFSVAYKDDPAVKENYAGRDIRSLPEAVEVLMTEVARRLRAIKPDALIEFRQAYMGPTIRKFGNMIRVGDCPGNKQMNRMRMAQLRLTSGATAVHADMLEWNFAESAEQAARNVIDSIFGTVQYSVMLRKAPASHLKALKHWIAFTEAHEAALQHGAFRPHHPEAGYPVVEAESAAERIVAGYLDGCVVDCGAADRTVHVLNGTGAARMTLRLAAAPAKVACFDTFGEKAPAPVLKAGVQEVAVPLSGRLVITPAAK